jgi:transposase
MSLDNVRLDQPVTDITGATGMRILRAIIEGERDARTLASLRDRRSAKSESEIAEALTGHGVRNSCLCSYRPSSFGTSVGSLRKCDEKIEPLVKTMPVRTCPRSEVPRSKPRKNQVSYDARTLLPRTARCGPDADHGSGVLTLLTLTSECGADLSRFPTDKHYISWLGLAPARRSPVIGAEVQEPTGDQPRRDGAASGSPIAAQVRQRGRCIRPGTPCSHRS